MTRAPGRSRRSCTTAGRTFTRWPPGPGGLVYDQLGEIYLFEPGAGKAHKVEITVDADLP